MAALARLALLALLVVLCCGVSTARASGTAHAYVVATPLHARLALRATPGGATVSVLGRRTVFGSPQTVAVLGQRGAWLEVESETLRNGQVAWAKRASVLVHVTRVALDVDLSAHRLRLLDGARVLRTVSVGIGRSGSSTPPGRYAVTDKLAGAAFGAAFGCCIVALSGHQPHPPAGWSTTRDWRLAIHGGGGLGADVSAGCIHASERDLRVLMRRVPLGAPVFVHP